MKFNAAKIESQSLSLYVHIPFCETKCPYCDFNTYERIEHLILDYIEALTKEIEVWGRTLNHPLINTVFFGGGTPSYLPSTILKRLMTSIEDSFDVEKDAERTLEANPGDLTVENLSEIRKISFNRLSIGIQSLDDKMLRLLGRRHTAQQAKDAATAAHQTGFDSLSLDLMFGLPTQSITQFKKTLQETMILEPNHLSLYGLIVEPRTPMEADIRTGKLPEPDPDIAADMYAIAQSMLAHHGYDQYEISNWARPNHNSQHNLTYWRSQPYLGVGPGAHSFLLGNHPYGVRFANIKSPTTYIRLINEAFRTPKNVCLNINELQTNPIIEFVETLDEPTAMGDTMMLGLRLNEGVSNAIFLRRFGRSIAEIYPSAVSECITDGLLTWVNDQLRLTEFGRPLGNNVFIKFLDS